MAFNPAQFNRKKKRAANPDVPRPNLFSHEKKIKETNASMMDLESRVRKQDTEIHRLQSQVRDMQSSIAMLLDYIRRRQ